MGYLSPREPFFQRIGLPDLEPGIHTDEASSALPDMLGELPDDVAQILAIGSPQAAVNANAEIDAAGGVRANPRKKGKAARAPRPAVLGNKRMFEISYLVTGMWGPDPAQSGLGVPIPPSRLVRNNPRAVRDNPRNFAQTFWKRMELLQTQLEEYEARVKQYYDDRKTANLDHKRPWSRALKRMRTSVEYARAQQHAAAPSVLDAHNHPLGQADGWLARMTLAKGGNSKLPFVSYSELPMATCPGAGECAVGYDAYEYDGSRGPGKKGWCYSFRAFRSPNAFARMFLCTLANTLDREIAIMVGGGGDLPLDAYEARVHAAVAGAARGARIWQQYVKGAALKLTRAERAKGAPAFIRLFVDGDINHEDSILAWMDAIAQMNKGSKDLEPKHGRVEVYGYSKCWQQFVNVDSWIQGRWPTNYTVNLSSGSIYARPVQRPGAPPPGEGRFQKVREAMQGLTISRGYFEAVKVGAFIDALAEQSRALAANPAATVPLLVKEMPFPVDAERVRTFVRINALETPAQALALFPELSLRSLSAADLAALTPDQVRHAAYAHHIAQLVADPVFGGIVAREMARDKKAKTEPAQLKAIEVEQRKRLAAMAKRGEKPKLPGPSSMFRGGPGRKAFALAMHEAVWSLTNVGGSCPLLCGNCSDHPTDPTLGVHRCASKDAFRGKKIMIGIH